VRLRVGARIGCRREDRVVPNDPRPTDPVTPPREPEPLAWTGATRANRPWLLVVPVVLLVGIAALGLLPSSSPPPVAVVTPSSSGIALAATPLPTPTATAAWRPSPTPRPSHDLAALEVRCMDVEPASCRRLANAAADAVEGDAVSAAVWASLICGFPSDCPSELVDADGAVGSVILTMADHRRWVANVNTTRSTAAGADPIVVVLGWHPGD
jgi:hypothetical protein